MIHLRKLQDLDRTISNLSHCEEKLFGSLDQTLSELSHAGVIERNHGGNHIFGFVGREILLTVVPVRAADGQKLIARANFWELGPLFSERQHRFELYFDEIGVMHLPNSETAYSVGNGNDSKLVLSILSDAILSA